jgi:hypothetical protein
MGTLSPANSLRGLGGLFALGEAYPSDSISDLLRASDPLGSVTTGPNKFGVSADANGLAAIDAYLRQMSADAWNGNALLAPAQLPLRSVFTSFQAEDKWVADWLRTAAKDPAYDISFMDQSVRVPFDSTDADYIKAQIRRRIRRSSITICLVGKTTSLSNWVRFEIMESADKGNRIIAMAVPGLESAKLPKPFEQFGSTLWKWDLDFLMSAIASAPAPDPYEVP